jgi:aldehyde dehydrogenase (NAD+)
MSSNGYKMYINGQWVSHDETFADYNPATAEVWAEIPNGTREHARKAIASAAAAQAEWGAMPHSQRAGYLLKASELLEKHQMDFANALIDEGGAWIGKSMFEAGYVPGLLRAAAAAVYQMTGEILPSDHGKVSMVVRQPLGVVSVISPWNFPLLLSFLMWSPVPVKMLQKSATNWSPTPKLGASASRGQPLLEGR